MAKGGKRRGAGRPKGSHTDIRAKVTAAAILEKINEAEAWNWALTTARKKRDVKTYIDALKYLTDRRDGKPRQTTALEGADGKPLAIQIISEVPRPERGNGS